MKSKILVTLFAFIFSNCATLSFEKYDTFGDWFLGDPGYKGAYYGSEPVGKKDKKPEESDEPKRGSENLGNCGNADPRVILGLVAIVVVVVVTIEIVTLYAHHIARATGFYHDPDDYEVMECGEIINESRQPIYLWLRTPELVFNPQGGVYFPEIQEREFSDEKKQCVVSETYERGEKNSIKFQILEAGIVDTAIPYRIWTSQDLNIGEKIGFTALTPIVFLPANILVKLFQLPYYVVRDVFQAFLIVPATIHYSTQED